ncbi:hypothetical protein PAAG_12645 [Paracoccidioides lutzii Pb01]|uniref:Uncharacterized protein n=1 Tax=Paracoccidioides lutzii (strain ATCC MYA-826 / Pb01) TaxID=502779 RepID=A0A0A2VIH2_PARBA|nr:hypothetical protein PAAG_12645 [Paracoccidioides lutzii Pb01]KGQ00689.1 hypothetical protein PAAG_12645 [Paracoccidioides lutzii Pb01]
MSEALTILAFQALKLSSVQCPPSLLVPNPRDPTAAEQPGRLPVPTPGFRGVLIGSGASFSTARCAVTPSGQRQGCWIRPFVFAFALNPSMTRWKRGQAHHINSSGRRICFETFVVEYETLSFFGRRFSFFHFDPFLLSKPSPSS